MATTPITPEQQELLDLVGEVWAAMPGLRLGQIIRYALEQPNVGRPIEALPVIGDDDIIRGLRALTIQLNRGRPEA